MRSAPRGSRCWVLRPRCFSCSYSCDADCIGSGIGRRCGRITSERYRSRFLKPHLAVGGRRAVYLTPEQHACLVCLLRELTPEGDCTVSSIVRNLVAAHLEEYRYPLQRWTRGRC